MNLDSEDLRKLMIIVLWHEGRAHNDPDHREIAKDLREIVAKHSAA